jgi:mycothiol synthase
MPEFAFRRFQGESDYPVLQSILNESYRADQIHETASLQDVSDWYAPSARFDPHSDIIFALSSRPGAAAAVIGFGRVRWYTGLAGVRLYSQSSCVMPDWRTSGVWPVLVQQNEQRLREMAATQPPAPQRFYQSWATESQGAWIAVLEHESYRAVRHFNNMLHHLVDIPIRPLPAGLEVRAVRPEHWRSIWEAQREVQQELFEVVLENWTEEHYAPWRADASHTPHLWQVAWDGDQVAGMVLNRIDERENKELGRQRGFTEHIFVRRPWRKRGLASALLAQSLQFLKAQGMEEAELGVDSENESGAFALYRKMGFRTYSTDIWFRKPME